MIEFKEKMTANFGVKLYDKLNSFILCTVTCTPEALYVTQTKYFNRLLARFVFFGLQPSINSATI